MNNGDGETALAATATVEGADLTHVSDVDAGASSTLHADNDVTTANHTTSEIAEVKTNERGADFENVPLATEHADLLARCTLAETQRDDAVRKAATSAAESERLRNDLAAVEKRASADSGRATAAETKASELESRLAQALQSARDAAAREQEALSMLKAAGSDKSKADEQIGKVRAELEQTQTQLAEAKQSAADATSREKEAATALKRASSEKEKTDKELAKTKAELDKVKAQVVATTIIVHATTPTMDPLPPRTLHQSSFNVH